MLELFYYSIFPEEETGVQNSVMYWKVLTTTPAIIDPGQKRKTTNTTEFVRVEVNVAMNALEVRELSKR